MNRLLRGDRAEAYFCGDDVLSIGALSACTEHGLDVPGDIGIIGLNDMEMARWQNIGLTTIKQPIPEIVEATIELLEAMLSGSEGSMMSTALPCQVVERGTLKAPG